MRKLVSIIGVTTLMLAGCGEEEVKEKGATKIESNTTSNSDTSNQKTSNSQTKEKSEQKEIVEQTTKEKETIETTTEEKTIEQSKNFSKREFSQEEQQAMTDEFYAWGAERAEIGGMALSKEWFNHGAAGRGDWYAETPDGDVQVQDNGNPGKSAFIASAVGGVVFYYRQDGLTGAKELDDYFLPAGFSQKAREDKDIHKYLLADNGKVYELILPYEHACFSCGFGEYDDNGNRGDFTPDARFEISGDSAAQAKWQEILRKYQ